MSGTVNYTQAADAALVLKYGDANQAVVKGLNSAKPPGFSREIITVQEFRQAWSRQFTGGAKMDNIECSGSLVQGDTKGQIQLRRYFYANTVFDDARLYLNLTDFVAPDLGRDPDTNGWQVAAYNPGKADVNGVFPVDFTIALNGLPCVFTIHRTDVASAKLAFVKGSGACDTITDSTSQFLVNGFLAGMTILVEGATTAANNGCRVIKTAAAGVLTLYDEGDADGVLTAGGGLVSEASPGAACTIHGGWM